MTLKFSFIGCRYDIDDGNCSANRIELSPLAETDSYDGTI
jgi:hypothetical protein